MLKKSIISLMICMVLFITPVSVAAATPVENDYTAVRTEKLVDLKGVEADDLIISVENSAGETVTVKEPMLIDLLYDIGMDIVEACQNEDPVKAISMKIASWIPKIAEVGAECAIQGLCIKIGIVGGPIAFVITFATILVVEFIFKTFFDERAVGDAISDCIYEVKGFVADATGQVVSVTETFISDTTTSISNIVDSIGAAIAGLNIGENVSNAAAGIWDKLSGFCNTINPFAPKAA